MKQWCSILCGLIVVLSLAACTAIGPRATEVPTVEKWVCITGCVDSLWIWLDGAVPQEFELELATEAGPIGRVRCVDGQAIECWVHGRHGCAMGGCFVEAGRQAVIWYGKPDNFDVTVTWDGNQIVEHIEPNYGEWSVCGNVCYRADVTITIPIGQQDRFAGETHSPQTWGESARSASCSKVVFKPSPTWAQSRPMARCISDRASTCGGG